MVGRPSILAAAWVVAMSGVPAVGSAATAIPDAGQLLREQQTPVTEAKRLTLADTESAPTPATKASGVTVAVKAFRFSGQEGLATEAELQELARASLARPVTIGELQSLADRISAHLRRKGFLLARAYLPKQDVTEGVVAVAIVQARVDGNATIKAAPSLRIFERTLSGMAADVVKPGQPLQERDLERVLLLMRDIPGVQARVLLEPGENAGTTRVSFDVSEGPRVSGSAWIDNNGNRHTGTWRGNAFVSVNDPLRIGDQLTLMLVGAEGLAQGRVGYSAPLGSRGLRGNVAFSTMGYKLVGDLASLDARGDANTFSAGLTAALIRRRNVSLSAGLGYEFRALGDDLFGFSIRDRRAHSVTLGLNGAILDRFAGGGFNSWSASAATGHLDLSRVRADENADRAGPSTAGTFTRLNLSFARQQTITDRVSFTGSYSGQFGLNNLDSSEKFSLGGPYGVRAYPIGEGAGDSGQLFTGELRRELLSGKWGRLLASVFVDAGLITLNTNQWTNAVSSATGKNEYWLSGVGVGLNLTNGRYSLRASYAEKLGNNPGRTIQGNDADGRNDSGRFWLTGQISL